MSTLREEFEAWHQGIGIFAKHASSGDYANSVVQSQWLAYQAATERAAKLAAELAYDAAIKYANGRQVDFEQEVGVAIRGAGGGA